MAHPVTPTEVLLQQAVDRLTAISDRLDKAFPDKPAKKAASSKGKKTTKVDGK